MSTQNRKIALVTGASRGLGRSIAESLAGRGYRVAVNFANSRKDAKNVVDSIVSQGGDAVAEQADIRDDHDIRKMIKRIGKRWGDVDILVNNATGPQPMKSIEDYAWNDFQDQLDFFVKAPVLLIKAVLPGMKSRRWGRVINVGSEVVDLGNEDFSAYVTAKAAMVGLTRALATEFGPWGITVNLIAPGWIPVERHAGTPENLLDAYRSRVPLGRFGTPGDIGAAVAYVAGEDAGFVTGQCLAVNGGNTF